ncbi:centromere protein V-like isoform X1 [Sinocyclocheilus grahami]|uniref:centromere protein V-like isoform X1 n=1 Tax=Sinocyclocheilus grahami TaxID=75366 RepID=UPI0007ACE7FA|nr:PREDICTED: centromere protein V-like isoform X1 [Sinocyclocheilus grahami]
MFYRRALLSSLNRLGRRRQTAGLPYKVRGAKRMAYITKDERERGGLVKHTGGCHCGAVRFELWSAPHLHVFNCNRTLQCHLGHSKKWVYFKALNHSVRQRMSLNLNAISCCQQCHSTTSCSICTKKQNCHFIVPKSQFTLLQGADNITTYTFNTRMAKHTFCKMCGVQSFYTPRSNPDGFGVAPHCLDPGTVSSVTVEDFCGQNWEESMQKHQTIRSMSKPTTDT